MLVLGHAGLTLGAAALATVVLKKRRSPVAAASDGSRLDGASWFTLLARHVDIRLLIVGSLLPDIIDKPVGQWFFRETFSYGRIFSHSLLFLALITLLGLYLYRRGGRNWLLVLAFGSFTHLVFDQMWLDPRTLFWPALGVSFERLDLSNWVSSIFQALLTKPETYVPELIGGAILAWFGLMVLRRRKVRAFIRHGRVA